MIHIQLEPQRTAWDLNWKMFGVPVRVHPLFWLAALLLSYDSRVRFEIVLLFMACIFLSILVHEFGHALSHVYFGDRNPWVVLYHMGGLCVSQSPNLTHKQHIIILLCGPGAGFILGAIAYGVIFGLEAANVAIPFLAAVTLWQLVFINVAWGILNLVPAFPLDGGQIVRQWVLWKKPGKGDRFAFTISLYACACAVAACVAWYFYQGGGDMRGLIPAMLFVILGFNSYHLRRQIDLYGEFGGGYEAPRQPWEQDADWWKRQ